MTSDFRSLNTGTAHLLPPRDVGASEGMRAKAGEIAALSGGRAFESLPYAGVPYGKAAASVRRKTKSGGRALPAAALAAD